jgi:hypothetical protein
MRGEGAASNNSNPIIRKKEMSMSSNPKGNGNAEPHTISAQAAQTGEALVGNAERDEDIRRRAYEIYLERGEQAGSELDDWLQAERELEGGVLAQVG